MVARFTRSCGAVVVAVAMLGACSSASKPARGATPTTALGEVSIVAFAVPKAVRCEAGSSATVRVSYSIQGARNQQVIVDGHVERGTDAARATVSVPIQCDAEIHTVALVAYDVRGRRITRVDHVRTIASGPTNG